MPIPDYQTLMLPLLQFAAQGEFSTSGAIAHLSDEFALTEEERRELLPSGRQAKMANRVHWALAYLGKAGLLERVRRGHYRITDRGLSVLQSRPERIDNAFLSQFEDFRNFLKRKTASNNTVVATGSAIGSRTPEERIEEAMCEHDDALLQEVLRRVLRLDPVAFERLIIALMQAMGYGARGAKRHLGKAGDGGIDGEISEDVLGLEVVHLQAKRYDPTHVIGVEKIREFAGALDARGVNKGVFVTTSSYSTAAKAYAEQSPKRLVLIDGAELAQRLIEHNVGVRVMRSYHLKALDENFFEEIA